MIRKPYWLLKNFKTQICIRLCRKVEIVFYGGEKVEWWMCIMSCTWMRSVVYGTNYSSSSTVLGTMIYMKIEKAMVEWHFPEEKGNKHNTADSRGSMLFTLSLSSRHRRGPFRIQTPDSWPFWRLLMPKFHIPLLFSRLFFFQLFNQSFLFFYFFIYQ